MNNIFLRKTILIASIMFVTANNIYSQLQDETLLKKAKLKTIEYKYTDYIAVGYIYKNQFVERQEITFFDKQTQDTIISGKYYIKGGTAYLDGIWKQNTKNGVTRARGLFNITNSSNRDGLTAKPKKGDLLMIEVTDIFYYQGFRNEYPAVLEKKSDYGYLLTVEYKDRYNLKELALVKTEKYISKKLIEEYGWFAIDDFMYYTTDVKNTYNNGFIIIGKVVNTKLEDNTMQSEFTEWEIIYPDGNPKESDKLTKLPDNNYKYRIKYSDRKKENDFASVEMTVDKSIVDNYGVFAMNDFIFNTTTNVKYTYKNGDVFIGKIENTKDSVNNSINSRLTVGKKIYVTGEVFEGDLSGQWFCGIPISGKMKFSDGSIEQGNWLTKYNLTKTEIDEVSKETTPTKKLILAKKLYKDRMYQDALYEAEMALTNKNYVAAKKSYLKALNIKPEVSSFLNTKIKKIEEYQAEETKRIAEQKQRNALKNKYGEYWGDLIYNKEYTPGMTKEMVLEFTSDKFYKIDRYIRSGVTIEVWQFDKDKMYWALMKESSSMDKKQKEAIGMAMLLGEFVESWGMGSIKSQFPSLVFTNGKLTDVYYQD